MEPRIALGLAVGSVVLALLRAVADDWSYAGLWVISALAWAYAYRRSSRA